MFVQLTTPSLHKNQEKHGSQWHVVWNILASFLPTSSDFRPKGNMTRHSGYHYKHLPSSTVLQACICHFISSAAQKIRNHLRLASRKRLLKSSHAKCHLPLLPAQQDVSGNPTRSLKNSQVSTGIHLGSIVHLDGQF